MRLSGQMRAEQASAIFRQLLRISHDVHLVVTQRTRKAHNELNARVDHPHCSQSERWCDERTLRINLSRQIRAVD